MNEVAECGMCHRIRPVAEWCFEQVLEDDDNGAYGICAECKEEIG